MNNLKDVEEITRGGAVIKRCIAYWERYVSLNKEKGELSKTKSYAEFLCRERLGWTYDFCVEDAVEGRREIYQEVGNEGYKKFRNVYFNTLAKVKDLEKARQITIDTYFRTDANLEDFENILSDEEFQREAGITREEVNLILAKGF